MTRLPLTYSQARYWHLQAARKEAHWNVPALLRITGPVDLDILRRALAAVVARHDGLRTRFEVDGAPLQVFMPPFSPDVAVVEGGGADGSWANALGAVSSESAVELDFAAEPPWRARLIKVRENEHICLTFFHHMITDLDSVLTIPREIARSYVSASAQRATSLVVPPMQYSEFARWHASRLESPAGIKNVEDRRRRFEKARPFDFGAGGRTATRGPREGHHACLSVETTQALEAIAASARLPMPSLVLAAVALFLAQRFDQNAFVMMMVSTYRSFGAHTTNVIGNFTNQWPLDVNVSPTESFRALAAKLRAEVNEAVRCRDVPTQLIFDTDNPLDHPLAAVVVNWINLDGHAQALLTSSTGDTTLEPVILGLGVAEDAPLQGGNPPFATFLVRAIRAKGQLHIFTTIALDVLARGTAREAGDALVQILERAARDPDAPVGG